ncbi:MAG: prepilin-type N-terminal cleavage/methylation domain-containing protein [Planctomycetota bacterium]|nr:prepilin-type N-terminal cleavage/methylation domain-containing protein [Planctomycetota bacterium]
MPTSSTNPTPASRSDHRGFTMIEILVVVGIIVVLMGLLLPALSAVRATANAAASQSNLKQWGTGTISYVTMHKERLPWEGLEDTTQMDLSLAEENYWANAIPPLLGMKPYSEIAQDAFDGNYPVPVAPEGRSIFIDPSASSDADAPWQFGPTGPGGSAKAFFFNYVPNSQLNNSFLIEQGAAASSPKTVMGMNLITDSAATILMVEMRSTKDELPTADVWHDQSLRRQVCNWKQFAARHYRGGHILFADGHVNLVLNQLAITNAQDSTDPMTPGGDWNKSGMIWDPMGPATDN